MARKPQAGRRFKYGLETVLKVRQIRERKEQEKFADKKRAYIKEKEKEEDLKEDDRQKKDTLRSMIKQGPIKDFAAVMRRKAHLGVLKEEIDHQVEKVIEASKVLEEQRAKLIASMKDKKIIEKDRANKLGQYKKLMESIELKFMDEIATERFKAEQDKKD